MADVARPPGDRGQLLIGAAIGLAILLVALALALNTAVYGEVHVSQTDNSLHEERAAMQYENSVERAVTGLSAAHAGNETGYEDLENDLRADVDRWDELSKRAYAGDDVVTNASIVNVAFESRIVQDENGTFVDRSDRSDWTLVDETSGVTEFELRIRNESLRTTDDCSSAAGCFTLEVEGDGGGVWQLFANTTSTGEGVAIAVESPDGSTDTCETTESTASVNVTEGIFDDESGSECSFTPFLEGLDTPYTLRYENAGNVTGTYDITVNGTVVEETVAEDDRYGTSGSPRIEPQIRTATAALEYRSTDLTYRTEIRTEGGADDE